MLMIYRQGLSVLSLFFETNIDLCAYYIPQYPRGKSVASAAYQELKTSVLEMEKSKILQEKKKIMEL